MTDKFPSQMVSNAENGSIPWRHHEIYLVAHLDLRQKGSYDSGAMVT